MSEGVMERFILKVGAGLGLGLAVLIAGELSGIQWLYLVGFGSMIGMVSWFVTVTLLIRIVRWLETT